MTEERSALVSLKVVGVVDATGELHARAVEGGFDTVCISAATDPDGLYREQFEYEAYHLPRWCEDNGFEYYEGEIETEVILEKQ